MDVSGISNGGPTGWVIIPNEWVNLVGVYDGISQNFFVNGELFSSRSATGNMNGGDGNRPIRFGGQGSYPGTISSGGSINGDITDIRVYNKALTAQEIKQNYNSTKSRFGL
jgi:hypothetical protein